MYINDIYFLEESDPFEIKTNEEATINLELIKVPSCFHTLLSGKVFSKDQTISNALVMVLDNNNNTISTAITDSKGNYKFKNILKPGKYKAIASAIGYCTSNENTVLIKPHEVTKLSFTLQKSLISSNGIVYGKILEACSREPITGAKVYLKSLDNHYKTVYNTLSNHSGQYIIYNILPNNYKMIIKKHGYTETELPLLKIEKHDRISLYFDLIRNSYDYYTISGVITVDNTPISNVAVFLYRLDNQKNENIVQVQETNSNGFYLFANVEAGSYLVKGTQQDSVIYEKFFTVD